LAPSPTLLLVQLLIHPKLFLARAVQPRVMHALALADPCRAAGGCDGPVIEALVVVVVARARPVRGPFVCLLASILVLFPPRRAQRRLVAVEFAGGRTRAGLSCVQ
jgi:hypothetical protein